MKFFSADLIYTNTGPALKNHVIVTDENGLIIDIKSKKEVGADIVNINGAITPGFVNAHCHLELSHLKGQLPTGTGLIPFINSVVTLRDFPHEEILDAIRLADNEMYENGIVAVGDISNKADTAAVKSKSNISYYTFVEMFDFLQEDQAQNCFDQYIEVFKAQSEGNGNFKSCVPHAPYSVSKSLFKLINNQNTAGQTVSIHNQETIHENLLFQDKTGELTRFFKDFNIDISDFKPTGKPSIDYATTHMDSTLKTLLIHNTMCDSRDIRLAHEWNKDTYWITCPNANLFIENRLPHYQTFIDENCQMAIGTDSLSSNWQLSIFEEMKTIQRYQSSLSTETLVKWSSYYGAEALGYENFGSISKGKIPGLIALEGLDSNRPLLSQVSKVQRLI